MLITLITFLIILSVLVLVHEFGHFITARRAGAKVEEFGLGFPPRLVGFRKTASGKKEIIWGSKLKSEDTKETIYSLNWFPLGGFVKIKGENGENETDEDSFSSKSAGTRSIILVAGVAMNVLLTVVLLTAVYMIGFETVLDESIPAKYIHSQHVEVVSVIDESPASEAGILPGDRLVAISGNTFSTIDDVQSYVSSRAHESLSIELLREGEPVAYTFAPYQLPDSDRYGLGVGLFEVGLVKYPIHRALWNGVTGTVTITAEIFKAIGRMVGDLVSTGSVEEQVAGPVGIAVLTNRFVQLGFVHVLQFTALLSINLAIINILPFPALDGGRILFILIEKFRGRSVSQKIENVAHMIGFALLILLIIVVTFNDFSQFGGQILGAIQGAF